MTSSSRSTGKSAVNPLEQSSLRAAQVTVGYGGEPVLTQFSFDVVPRSFTAIIGPNGCGKSTLVNTLARTIAVQAGEVLLDGTGLSQWRSIEVARRIALLPQAPVIPEGITVRGLVARGRHPYHSALRQWAPGDDEAIAAALSATETTELADRPMAELSGGQRQRAWIAMVLAQQTEFVLLDEPTSYLDLAHQLDVMELCQDVRDSGRSVIAVLHDLNQAARYADRLVLMREGKILAEGDPAEVVIPELILDAFGVRVRVVEDPEAGTPMMIPLAERRSPTLVAED